MRRSAGDEYSPRIIRNPRGHAMHMPGMRQNSLRQILASHSPACVEMDKEVNALYPPQLADAR